MDLLSLLAQVTPTTANAAGGPSPSEILSWVTSAAGALGTLVAALVGVTQILEYRNKQRQRNDLAGQGSAATAFSQGATPAAPAATSGSRRNLSRAIAAFLVAILMFSLGAFIGPALNPQALPATTVPSGGVYVEYILDASRGMGEHKLDGKTKLEIARDVLKDHVSVLPSNLNVGLRIFGMEAARGCEDTKLVVPIQSGGSQAIIDWLPKLEAHGTTPLAESLKQAGGDFQFTQNSKNSVILVSDIIETCAGDPVQVIKSLQDVGINFTAHVIGLAVDDTTSERLNQIATISGGTYHDAKSEKELKDALEAASVKAAETPTPEGMIGPTATLEQVTATPQSEPPTNTPEPVVPTPEPPSATPVPPTEVPVLPTPTAVPAQEVDVTKEGTTAASSEYSNGKYPVENAFDGDPTTSWFSNGPDPGVGTTTLRWEGDRDQIISEVFLLNNSQNSEVEVRKGYGFEAAKVQVLDASGKVVFEQDFKLPGTPDPNVRVHPGVMGRTVVVIFSKHEANDCGGISEMQVKVRR